MKNFQANLFIVLAISLCGLCAWQWYEQTAQRTEIQTLNRMVYDRDAAIQGYTNSLATLNHQLNQMDASLTEVKAVVATNEQCIIYKQLEPSQLLDPATKLPLVPPVHLPAGSLWVRRLSQWNSNKFKEIPS